MRWLALLLIAVSFSGCRDLDKPRDRIVGHWQYDGSGSFGRTRVWFTPLDPNTRKGMWYRVLDDGREMTREYSIAYEDSSRVVILSTDDEDSEYYTEFIPSVEGDSLFTRQYTDFDELLLMTKPYEGVPSQRLSWMEAKGQYVDSSTRPD